MATRAEKQAQTRQALLDAGQAVFLERGFAGASVDAIAARAGYTRGAFYSNFGSKEELFAELLDQRVFEVFRRMARDRLTREPAGSPPREVGEELVALHSDEERHWAWSLLLELVTHADRHPEFRAIAARFWRGTRDLTAEVVRREAAARGIEPPADPRSIATALIALDIGLAMQHSVDREDVPLSLYPELYELLFAPLRDRP